MQYTGPFVQKLFKAKIYRMIYFRYEITVHYRKHLEITVAEKDTAAAANLVKPLWAARKPPLGRPSAAAGRRGLAAPANLFQN